MFSNNVTKTTFLDRGRMVYLLLLLLQFPQRTSHLARAL